MLTTTNVHNHYPETVETPRGYLNQKPAGVRFTKPQPAPFAKSSARDLKQAFNKKEQDVYIKVWEAKDIVYSDQPANFLVQLHPCYSYQMIMVLIDSNAVLAEPMKNWSATLIMNIRLS